jgi:NADP-dependent 3-hydroxy acid dehydrogenase YdfG
MSREPAVALVTGASSGIGRASVLALARRGYRVVASARRAGRLAELGGALAADGYEHLELPLDLAEPGAPEAAVSAAATHWGRLDVVVAAAGHGRGYGAITEAAAGEWPGQLAVNLAAPMSIAASAMKYLRRTRGHLVVIGSVFATERAPAYSAYAATKHGLAGFVRSIQREEVARDVRITLIHPGSTNTEFSAATLGRPDPAPVDEALWPFKPLAAEDVAAAVVWVLSQPPHVTIEELTLRATADR